MGNGDGDTAATLLQRLHEHYRQHPVTGASGHSYISSEPRATASTPGLPFNLHVVDHIDNSLGEIEREVRALNPDAEPRPEQLDRAYDWYIKNTFNSSEADQQRRDTIIVRQRLEHAIEMGDTSVIRPHRCPACRRLGLFWENKSHRALCTYTPCRDENGVARRWTLAHLAYQYIAARKNVGHVSAT
ncbi:hypothetical protein AB0454_22705 [Streptomyces sp. NPDC093509]|uniref:hypothetical protein n=1 Tax=Streptomyces sp. NPDC093509 TaxID=3154982 RepID=UPI00344E1AE2